MPQKMNDTAETEKNTTMDARVAEKEPMPKRRGRPKRTEPAAVEKTSALGAVADEPAAMPDEPAAVLTGETGEAGENSGFAESAAAASDASAGSPAKRHYPTLTERLAAADANITRLTKLNESRADLVAKTQATLEDRRAALEKAAKALADAQAKKTALVELQNRPAKPPVSKAPKLAPEERRQARLAALERARAVRKAKKEARMAEEAKVRELVEKLKTSGQSVDELLQAASKLKE